ncbi:uncharacterized protein LOC123554700 [Mercenaria mercenaria]|uniref:uncharacterized protein LOC123554700 n=1 Tax=Mercenaria mercenaria TaxID=6596 RepID=UPI00234E48D6|nr:uncharacterized protein LOC123554700 [Mercenaria mercenaria]
MPTDIYNEKFQNWVKGILALNTTRKALKTTVEKKWTEFISALPETERSQMETFVRCLNRNGICYFKSWRKEKNITWQCDHKVCRALLEKFIKLDTSTRKLKIEYDRKAENTKYESDQCPPENKPDDAEMLDPGVNSNESENLVNANSQYGDSQDMVWQIAKLYIFGEKGGGTYKSIDDLDISKIVIMMRSCELFTFDGSLHYYDEVLDVRNELMHSTSNHLSDARIAHILKEARDLLNDLSKTVVVTDVSFCTEAVRQLQQLEVRKFSVKQQSSEYRDMVRKIRNAEKAVLELDTSIEESSIKHKSKSKQLIDLLNKVKTDMEITDLEKEEKISEFEPSEFKNHVKSAIESKRSAIESDISECENTGENNKQLVRLLEDTDGQLEDVDQLIAEPEPDEVLDLISSLNKEVTVIRSECKKCESEILEHDKKIDELNAENTILQELVKNQKVHGNLKADQQGNLITRQPRISLDKRSRKTDGYFTTGGYEAIEMQELFTQFTLAELVKKANKVRRRKRRNIVLVEIQ